MMTAGKLRVQHPVLKSLISLISAAILRVSFSLTIVFGHEERAGITTVVRLKRRPQNVTLLSIIDSCACSPVT